MLQILNNFKQFKTLIADQTTFLIYKYNPNNCPLSDKTKPKLEAFLAQHSDIAGYMIDVIDQPELKLEVADHLQIPHESPQVICFKSGEYTAHTSHMKIRERWLEEIFS